MTALPRLIVLFALALLVTGCVTNVAAEKATRFDQGIAAYDAGDYTTAYRIWEQLAREDDLAAMRNTAQLLRQGKGVAKDSSRAFSLYKEAAEKGFVTAMANVADMYLVGEGVEKNVQAAAAWYARAATAGLSIAQMKLSEMYEQGVGVERDPGRSRALLERAARNGYAPAQSKLQAMGVTLTVEDGAAPQRSAGPSAGPDDAWRGGGTVGASKMPGAGSNGRPSAGDDFDPQSWAKMSPPDRTQMQAGLAAYNAQNKPLAFATWRNVALRGNADAQLRVALLYEHGDGTGQDMIEAYRWLRLSAQQGNVRAQSELSLVAAQLAPAERAIAESLVRLPANEATKAP